MILSTDKLNDAEYCQIQQIDTIMLQCGFIMLKIGQLREYIEYIIIKSRESGIINHLSARWKIPEIDCSLVKNLNRAIDFQHFAPALLFLIAGMTISIIAMLLEFIIYRSLN